jgi:hypothetical protein
MILVQTVTGIQEERIKENDREDEFNYDIL